MSFRNALLNIKIYNKKSLWKYNSIYSANYSNHVYRNLKGYDHSKKNLLSPTLQQIRYYNLSEKLNISLSKYLSVGPPLKNPEIHSNKSTGLPPIEPGKLNEVLSEVQSTSQLKIKESSIESKKLETPTNTVVPENQKPVAKLTIVEKIKHEIKHYYHGLLLLGLDIKTASILVWSIMKGHTLSRRERKQLVRTVADLARMIPFIVFIIVPLMEFLLPFYIKLFPFMMPSTFKESSKEAEKTRQLLKGKLEMAKFLQDTLEEAGISKKYSSEGTINLESFNNFMKQVRETGQTASTDDIVKFSRLFEDEVTLESLEHRQLKALCQLLEVNSIGPKALLVFHLKLRVHQLKIDDKMIRKEGMDKVPAWELQQLCRERGMRAMGVNEERLRYQLSQWLKLSIDNQVPVSLLLLSRTMYLPDHLSAEQQLTKTILHLPTSASKAASLRTESATDHRVDMRAKYELMKEQNELIKEEKRIEREKIVDTAPVVTVETEAAAAQKQQAKAAVATDRSISGTDLSEIESAIESMESAKTALQQEELDELKDELEESRSGAASVGGQDKVGRKLSRRLQSMIAEMDSMLARLQVKKEEALAQAHRGDTGPATGREPDRAVVSIDEVMQALRQLQKVSGDEVRWQRVLEVLDEDHDGRIEVRHVTEVLDLLGDDNQVQMSSKELARVLDAIDKEDAIDDDQLQQQRAAQTAGDKISAEGHASR